MGGRVWVGSFGNDGLFEIDPQTGVVLNTYPVVNSTGTFQRINGLAVDTLGRILCTQRITFSGVGAPCEVQRVDPATGAMEVPMVLSTGGSTRLARRPASARLINGPSS